VPPPPSPVPNMAEIMSKTDHYGATPRPHAFPLKWSETIASSTTL